MTELLIPYAESEDGRLVTPDDAVSGKMYWCPSCEADLVLKVGLGLVRRHFSHPAHGACSQESVLHNTAKRLLAQCIEEHARGDGQQIELVCQCSECHGEWHHPLPRGSFDRAALEVSIGGYRSDVVAFRGKEIVLAIEVLVSNAVSSEKSRGLPVSWIELRAEEALDQPLLWKPVAARLKPIACRPCSAKVERVRQVARAWNIPDDLYTPYRDPEGASYVAAVEKCFRCGEDIPVFWWRGVPYCQVEPPAPRPCTLQWRRSRVVNGSYWANTCPNPKCKMIQGDHHLFESEQGVLHGLPLDRTNLPRMLGLDPTHPMVKRLL